MRSAIGYVRVSTAMQGTSGLGLDAQQRAVRQLAVQHRVDLAGVLVEVESGSRRDRPVLLEALRRCRDEGHALVVARLDRLGRNAAHLLALRDAGVAIVAADLPGGLEGPAATLVFGVLATVAQAERESISLRTRAALRAAKARGVQLGSPCPEKGAQAAAAARGRRADEHAEGLRLLVEHLLRANPGAKPAQLAQLLEARGARAPRGKARWSTAQAERLLRRLAG